MKKIFICILSTALHFSGQTQQIEASILSINNDFRIHLTKSNTVIANCGLAPPPASVSRDYEHLRLSFDQAAIIFSDALYLPISELLACGDTSLAPREAAPKTGMLGDISLATGIYVSLELVGTQPLSFLATVAKIGKSKNLVDLPGAYPRLKSTAKINQSFSYSTGMISKISLNGQYVAVNGDVDCSSSAFPGVWDIKKNAKIKLTGDSNTIKTKCNALFWKAGS
jgi:hypothetical protein